jgi:predicted DNA-binding transcriptional regulator YafY
MSTAPRKARDRARPGAQEDLERFLTMIPYLYENGRVPMEEVAARFHLAPEEVVAAIDRISTLGDDVLEPHQLIDAYIEDGYVGMDLEPALKRPIRLSARQAFALLVGADFLRAEGYTVSPALAKAVDKVRRATSAGQLGRLEELERVIAFDREGITDAFRRLERARAEREQLEIDYLADAGESLTTRRIDPYLLWNYGGAWYCAAWCHLRGDTRTFRLSRVREARPTGERFEIDPSFDAARYREGPVYVPGAGDITVRVRFAPEVARFVLARCADALIERERGGALVVTRRARSAAWVVKWLLPYGPGAEILEPASAREAMREACRRVLARYEAPRGRA